MIIQLHTHTQYTCSYWPGWVCGDEQQYWQSRRDYHGLASPPGRETKTGYTQTNFSYTHMYTVPPIEHTFDYKYLQVPCSRQFFCKLGINFPLFCTPVVIHANYSMYMYKRENCHSLLWTTSVGVKFFLKFGWPQTSFWLVICTIASYYRSRLVGHYRKLLWKRPLTSSYSVFCTLLPHSNDR